MPPSQWEKQRQNCSGSGRTSTWLNMVAPVVVNPETDSNNASVKLGKNDEKIAKAKFSHFQKSYAFVLAHGLDAVNADMQNMAHLKENYVATATSHDYFNVA